MLWRLYILVLLLFYLTPLNGQRIKADFIENATNNLVISDTGQFEVFAQFPKKDQYTVQLAFSPVKPVFIGFGFFDRNSRDEISPRSFSQGYIHNIDARSFRSEIGLYHVILNSGLSKNKPGVSAKSVSAYQYQRGLVLTVKTGVSINTIANLYNLEDGAISRSRFKYTDYDLQTGFYMRGKNATIGINIGYKIRRYRQALVHNPINNAISIERFFSELEDDPNFNTMTLGINCQVGVKPIRIFGGVLAHTWNEENLPQSVFEGAVMYSGIIIDMNSLSKFFKKKKK